MTLTTQERAGWTPVSSAQAATAVPPGVVAIEPGRSVAPVAERPGVPPGAYQRRPDLAWKDHGACREHEADMWFPPGPQGTEEAQAKAICARCPVLGACLSWALDNPRLSAYGIWGGTNEDERRGMRQAARGAA